MAALDSTVPNCTALNQSYGACSDAAQDAPRIRKSTAHRGRRAVAVSLGTTSRWDCRPALPSHTVGRSNAKEHTKLIQFRALWFNLRELRIQCICNKKNSQFKIIVLGKKYQNDSIGTIQKVCYTAFVVNSTAYFYLLYHCHQTMKIKLIKQETVVSWKKA